MPKLKIHCHLFLKILALFGVHFFVSGYTFLVNPAAKLPSEPESPEIEYLWDGIAPELAEKDTYRDGFFADYTDQDAMRALLLEAAESWSNVPGSYLKLKIVDAPTEAIKLDTDRKFSIVTAATGNLNSAAYAVPTTDRTDGDGKTIIDCDIVVGDKKVTMEFMLYMLTHEFGHCIGLGHAHDNYRAVMGYARNVGSAKLSADDKAGLIYLYPDPAYGDPTVREAIAVKCGVVTGGQKFDPGFMFLFMHLGLLILLVPWLANNKGDDACGNNCDSNQARRG